MTTVTLIETVEREAIYELPDGVTPEQFVERMNADTDKLWRTPPNKAKLHAKLSVRLPEGEDGGGG